MNPKRRACLGIAASLPIAGLLSSCASMTSGSTESFDARIDLAHSGSPGAMVNGVATYRSLQTALDAAPADGKKPWRIHLPAGRYYEKVVVTKPNIHLVGESRDKSVLTFDAYSGLAKPG